MFCSKSFDGKGDDFLSKRRRSFEMKQNNSSRGRHGHLAHLNHLNHADGLRPNGSTTNINNGEIYRRFYLHIVVFHTML